MSKRSVVNLANIITIVGFALVVYGSTILYSWAGILIVAAGRLLDLLDGKVARMQHTSSRFGATLDATLDKFGGLAILIAEWHYGIAPVWALLAMFIQNVANALATFLRLREHQRNLQPSSAGKHAMFCQNLAVGSFALAFALKGGATSGIFWWFGVVFTFVGVGYFGVRASYEYFAKVWWTNC